ncbi:uncharacterized protein V6R79_020287 [Siganus canaliculatus]
MALFNTSHLQELPNNEREKKVNRYLVPGATPVLFAWNGYSQLPDRASVWQTKLPFGPEDEPEKEEMDAKLVLQCHDYAKRPDPSALDVACEKIQAQQRVIEELQKRLSEVALKQTFGLRRFMASDDDIRFYTRFASYHHLEEFWKQIEPATKRMIHTRTQASISSTEMALDHTYSDPLCQQSRCLPLIDELFLFLMFLSLGLKEKDLGERFNIHQSTVSRTIKTWADFLYTLLGAVGIWMSSNAIRASMPSVFSKYSDTQVIVDCTELRCQLPSCLLIQSEMCSNYKSHATLKGLIGISPHGAVTFISSLYSGSVSDKELFRESGIIPLLDKDMAVMVNKELKIDDLVPCNVYRLPFLCQTPQLCHEEVLLTQDIADLRIHVERTIRRIKENKLFDSVIPLSIAGSINQLFVVACLLFNYQNKPLIMA